VQSRGETRQCFPAHRAGMAPVWPVLLPGAQALPQEQRPGEELPAWPEAGPQTAAGVQVWRGLPQPVEQAWLQERLPGEELPAWLAGARVWPQARQVPWPRGPVPELSPLSPALPAHLLP
jgi:hypothetical protein